jgi:hypothetical protein
VYEYLQRQQEAAVTRPPLQAYKSRYIQHEWQYLQWVTAFINADFESIERAIQQDFLSALFGNTNVSEDKMRSLTLLPVKFVGVWMFQMYLCQPCDIIKPWLIVVLT